MAAILPRGAIVVKQQITVRTPRVDQVAAAAQQTAQLLQKGIVLNSTPGQGLAYKFTGLNSIKPDMITEATRNARAAADRFASDSGSRVGYHLPRTRAYFPFCGGREPPMAQDGGQGSGADGNLMKTVRVVTTVQYYLEE